MANIGTDEIPSNSAEFTLKRTSSGRYLTFASSTEFCYSVEKIPVSFFAEGGRKVIASYLPAEVTDAELRNICGAFGEVEIANVVRDHAGLSCGYGFCTFVNVSSACKAISMLDGGRCGSKVIRVERALLLSNNRKRRRLLVRKMPAEWDIDSFRAFFEKFGQLTRAKLMNQASPIGFVEYIASGDALRVAQEFGQASGAIFVEFAQKRGAPPTSTSVLSSRNLGRSLYVGNLTPMLGESYLSELFGGHGVVTAIKIIKCGYSNGGGWGFVAMSTAEQATAAIAILDGSQHDGVRMHVSKQK